MMLQVNDNDVGCIVGGVMAVLSAMMGSGGTGQGDSEFEDSVHEVVLNESDIRQFDDEFSDLETTADFEEEELRCEGDEFSSSHWNFLEEKFPQLTDQRLEPINEEPIGSQLFDYDSSEIGNHDCIVPNLVSNYLSDIHPIEVKI